MFKSTLKILSMLTCLLALTVRASTSPDVLTLPGTVTFETAPGATESGGNPVDARATFVTSLNTITITLTNLEVNPRTIAQDISGLSFAITTGQTSGTLSSSSGRERTVANNGTFTDGAMVSTGWSLSGLTLSVLGTMTAPQHTIIGPAGSGSYSNGNSSITGNGPHNPFLTGDVTFTLNVPGVTASSSIRNVVFSFGTAPGNNVAAVPEPGTATFLLFGVGALLGAGSLMRRKQR